MRKAPLNFDQKVASVATRSGRSPENQAQPTIPVVSGRDEEPAPSAAEKPAKRTVAALDRNIDSCNALIERTEAKIELVRGLQSHERNEDTVPSLKKALSNLQERKAILERLRAKELRYDDR